MSETGPGDVLLTVRVSEAAEVVEGSIERRCRVCLAGVWVSPASQQILAQHPTMPIICIHCIGQD